jgi:hypothetical protein
MAAWQATVAKGWRGMLQRGLLLVQDIVPAILAVWHVVSTCTAKLHDLHCTLAAWTHASRCAVQ